MRSRKFIPIKYVFMILQVFGSFAKVYNFFFLSSSYLNLWNLTFDFSPEILNKKVQNAKVYPCERSSLRKRNRFRDCNKLSYINDSHCVLIRPKWGHENSCNMVYSMFPYWIAVNCCAINWFQCWIFWPILLIYASSWKNKEFLFLPHFSQCFAILRGRKVTKWATLTSRIV